MSDPVVSTQQFGYSPFPELPGQTAHQPSPVAVVRRSLRGRYVLAVVLGAVLALPAAYMGFNSTAPMYQAVGMVRVAPTIPVILHRTEENQLPPLFESYVATQAAFITHRRVLDAAVSNPELRAAGWPQGIAGVAALERAVQVTSTRGAELIRVSVLDDDPVKAVRALNAVLSAFDELKDDLAGNNPTSIERTLIGMQSTHSRNLAAKEEEILSASLAAGSGNVQELFNRKTTHIADLDTDLSRIQRQIAALQARRVEAADQGDVDAAAMTRDMLAVRDPVLQGMLEEIAGVDALIATSQSQYGPRHPEMVQLQNRRSALEMRIQGRERFLRESPQIDFGGGAHAGMTLAQLEHERESILQIRQRLMDETQKLSRTIFEINRLKTDAEELRRNLEDVNSRLTALRTERQNATNTRVTVHRGDMPTGPAKDRRKVFALAAAMAGGGLGVGLVALFGLLRGGYRYIDELEDPSLAAPLLGTIPDLRTGDAVHDELAALSVHHLRNMLQQSAGPAGARGVHAITSGSSGDGKTSLALALGMSFAVSGHRTLLLDGDLVGRRLSRLLGLARSEGLTNIAGADKINGEIHSTQINNLWALPVGNAEQLSPERLSAAELEKLLNRLRERFDQIIIDTGPVLGSLEAGMLCPLADRTVLIVSAGQNPKLVQASIHRIRQLGATCAGIVFNRARRDDFDRSVSAGPMSRSVRSVAPGHQPQDDGGGSLIRALAAEQTASPVPPRGPEPKR